jgi:D-alanyl-D-alanine carboxypeptidase
MLKLRVKKRRVVLIVILAVVLLVFGGAFGAVEYYGNQAIAKQQTDSKAQIALLDKKIADIKAKKAAEKKAADAAAAQKAAADAALTAQQNGQVVTPAGCAIKGAHGDPNAIDVVVNKKHCFTPIDFTPSDFVTLYGATISAKVSADFTAMYQAAATAGVPISVTSSFRSYSNQVATYNNWVKVNGSTASADTVSARPGYSEHQTGFAMDLSAGNCSLECFLNSAQYTWLTAHSAEYGWIQRYPIGLESVTGYSSEAWHYRYVGKAVALDMKSKGIKTLEQYWGISGGDY